MMCRFMLLISVFIASVHIQQSTSFSLHVSSSSSVIETPSGQSQSRLKDLNLGKSSTALDVLKELNQKDLLSEYVTKGGIAIVTGGSSGIGAASAETLALSGMKVVLCARNIESAEKVKSKMIRAGKNIRIQELDLADLSSVQSAAKSIVSNEKSVDVILNNAGVMAVPNRVETRQGFELQFGTNHVGHHMFTRLLLPSMNKGGRVVTVASTAHNMVDTMDFDNLNFDKNYSPWGAYGQSKLANILFAKGLDDRLKSSNIQVSSVSLHPGVISTNLWRNTPNFLRPFTNLFADKTIAQGAATSVYCSLIDSTTFQGGEYFADCKVVKPNNNGEDKNSEFRNKLWISTENMITRSGFELPESLI